MPALDGYGVVARLYPALLTLLPVAWSVGIEYPGIWQLDVLKSTLLGLVIICIAYLFASIARSRGKAIQPGLLTAWGGWPSTTMLRHSDTRIDEYTKSRYHLALEQICPNLSLPSAQEELSSSAEADKKYRSATMRLIEARRGVEYTLIHKENASYGFRRNLLGMKAIAVPLAAALFALTLALWLIARSDPTLVSSLGIEASGLFQSLLLVALALDLTYLALWLLFVRRPFVHQAAEEYARALLRTLDLPAGG